MERINNVYEVTQRLCGIIEPYGDSAIDKTRFQNLEATIEVAEKLIHAIIDVEKYKNRHEFSMSKAGKEAEVFLMRLKDRLNSLK